MKMYANLAVRYLIHILYTQLYAYESKKKQQKDLYLCINNGKYT